MWNEKQGRVQMTEMTELPELLRFGIVNTSHHKPLLFRSLRLSCYPMTDGTENLPERRD